MYAEQLQTLIVNQDPQDRMRARRLHGVLTELTLRDENTLYANTRGLSQNNRQQGFQPGYLNRHSGECVLSCFGDGNPAPIHVLDGLPSAWVMARDADGHVTSTVPEIVSGFIRDGVFYTRDEAIKATAH
ncbi:hypothetical protein [Thiobaca trueperi]|uniref:Uncharacterized protein n=1 Tax=Thiobaca trueperi TaxID=127458 RepID=A0A4R3MYL9_9GAMM|nr:hypothetical protein [Thiobaca trueperi]TCT21484.1 hypothetical protein EDC35_104343 [Thiobaca trueperi]